MTSFPYKGYGYILVPKGKKSAVADIIREMDQFEWEYFSTDLLVESGAFPFGPPYIGKFECDLDELHRRCAAKNITVRFFQEERNIVEITPTPQE